MFNFFFSLFPFLLGSDYLLWSAFLFRDFRPRGSRFCCSRIAVDDFRKSTFCFVLLILWFWLWPRRKRRSWPSETRRTCTVPERGEEGRKWHGWLKPRSGRNHLMIVSPELSKVGKELPRNISQLGRTERTGYLFFDIDNVHTRYVPCTPYSR